MLSNLLRKERGLPQLQSTIVIGVVVVSQKHCNGQMVVDPLASKLVQLPTAPLMGAVAALQGLAKQVAAVKLPA